MTWLVLIILLVVAAPFLLLGLYEIVDTNAAIETFTLERRFFS